MLSSPSQQSRDCNLSRYAQDVSLRRIQRKTHIFLGFVGTGYPERTMDTTFASIRNFAKRSRMAHPHSSKERVVGHRWA